MRQINKVLLIDDDEITNIMHRRVIEKSGRAREVLVATDGKAALDLLQQHIAENKPLPELIFLDINMPRMGGFEFLEEYAASDMGHDGEKIIVMLSTSLLKSDHERASADPNVHSFANKIIQTEVFLALVDEYFSSEQKSSATA